MYYNPLFDSPSFTSDIALIDRDQDWFVDIELYGGKNSAIAAIANNATAFARRDTLFTFQLYASSSNGKPPYPQDGFQFVNGMLTSVTSNMHSKWNYGAYTDYIDDELDNRMYISIVCNIGTSKNLSHVQLQGSPFTTEIIFQRL